MAGANASLEKGGTIVWFRYDLRLGDNRALSAAVDREKPVICLFILDESENAARSLGGARRWWLHHSLAALDTSLRDAGNRLILRRGPAHDVLQDLIADTGADAVYWNRRYDPAGLSTDKSLKNSLPDQGIEVASFDGQLLHEPTRLLTSEDEPYKVFTPFWKKLASSGEPREPLSAPESIPAPKDLPKSDSLDSWNLTPSKPDWSGGIAQTWAPGERSANECLDAFASATLKGYAGNRDRPDTTSTSGLSPHLAFGEITPFQIWHAVGADKTDAPARDIETFRKEVAWREFSYHLLFHFPDLTTSNFNERFDDFPWRKKKEHLRAWQRGQTGIPLVDAGMRQLWQTGWMHNRVRMITASFMTKNLLIDWREGECWFWDTLVDADPASNAASWQWVAGSGADAAPYFRIFNPVLQGKKFDPDGDYVRRYVPELAELDPKYIHDPWEAPQDVLEKSGIELGKSYPKPIVNLKASREDALEAAKSVRKAA